jgi:hypothetical protein
MLERASFITLAALLAMLAVPCLLPFVALGVALLLLQRLFDEISGEAARYRQ